MKTEEKISKTLLDDNSTPFSIKVSHPAILRMIGIRKIKLRIKDLKLGTLYKLSTKLLALKLDITEGENKTKAIFLSMNEGMIDIQAECIAIAILNNPFRIRIWKRLLKRFLVWNLDAKSMNQLLSLLLEKMNIMDFMSSIVSIGGLQIVRKETSLESDTGGTIAPGTISET